MVNSIPDIYSKHLDLITESYTTKFNDSRGWGKYKMKNEKYEFFLIIMYMYMYVYAYMYEFSLFH